jgi:flagellar biosynthesis protein FlhG
MRFAETELFNGDATPLIVSVLSGKGGVGKSVMAYNLAERVSARGLRTLLIDADSFAGNLHLLANASAMHGLDQYASGELTLRQAVTALNPNFDLLARTETGPIAGLATVTDAAEAMAGLQADAVSYDVIVIDHSSGISSIATTIASASDICLLVVVPELTSIADGYGLFKYLCAVYHQIDCRLLVNRARSSADADYLIEKFSAMTEKFLRVSPRLFGWISEHEVVAKAVAAQRPIAQIEPKSFVAQQVNRLVDVLALEHRQARERSGTAEIVPANPLATHPSTINNSPASADIKG